MPASQPPCSATTHTRRMQPRSGRWRPALGGSSGSQGMGSGSTAACRGRDLAMRAVTMGRDINQYNYKCCVTYLVPLQVRSHAQPGFSFSPVPSPVIIAWQLSLSNEMHAQTACGRSRKQCFANTFGYVRQDLADVRARQQGPAAACPDITVRHLPLHACALDSGAFVLPAAGGAAAQARLHGGVAGYGWPQAPAAGEYTLLN